MYGTAAVGVAAGVAYGAYAAPSCYEAVDPYGRVIEKTPLFTQQLLVADLRFLTARTIYTRFGDVVAWASLAFTVAALLASARVRYN